MTSRLAHRGPDDDGQWIDPAVGVALGHRRLSIVDLSPMGRQPMISPRGRYVTVFNGEVYNHDQLRDQLLRENPADLRFRGHSDTEVLLAAIEAWGLREALGRFVGMFAMAVWDRRERALHLVRDRLGVKPICYGWAGRTFVFGSELKALAAHPGIDRSVSREAVALLLRYNCIPAPHAAYRGVHKLLPGTILTLRSPEERPAPVAFWSLGDVVRRGRANPFEGTEDEAVAELDRLLREAVALRMIADVPLGALLSGGIDSSAVAALMQAQSGRPVNTFTIGCLDRRLDEARHAGRVARHLGTDHRELYVTPKDALDTIPDIAAVYDEPFGDSSQVPTYLVARLARQHVTVVLSGDGGDEVFAGYNRHVWLRRVWNGVRWLPPPFRRAQARALVALSPEQWNWCFDRFSAVLPQGLQQGVPGDKLHKLAGILAAAGPDAMYRQLVSHWSDPERIVPGVPVEPGGLAEDAPLTDLTEKMLYRDMLTYLPDDILTKVDRATMAVGLEARVPLLDHRVVEFAWRIPLSMKVRRGRSKWLLRQVLHRYVPDRLIERPKAGFGLPIASWLRGPLRGWAEALLDRRRLIAEGFFEPAPVLEKWSEHLSGRRNWDTQLWGVLMFQAWYDANRRSAGMPAQAGPAMAPRSCTAGRAT